MKRRFGFWPTILAAFIVAGLWMSVSGAELKPDGLPKAVKDAVMKMFPDGKIAEAELERRITQFYSVGVIVDGREREVSVTADGVVLETEEEIDAEKVPEAIQESLRKMAPEDQWIEMERIVVYAELKPVPVKEPRTEYEAEVRVERKDRAVRLSEAGEAVGDAAKQPAEPSDDEDD